MSANQTIGAATRSAYSLAPGLKSASGGAEDDRAPQTSAAAARALR
jgi:hypothetical protein